MKSLRVTSLGLVAIGLFASCATTPEQKAADKAKEDAEGYVRYVPTGSHISERVSRKKAKVDEGKTQSDQDLVRDLQRDGHMTLEGAENGPPLKK